MTASDGLSTPNEHHKDHQDHYYLVVFVSFVAFVLSVSRVLSIRLSRDLPRERGC